MKFRSDTTKPSKLQTRLAKLSQRELQLQADASMFAIGRAVTHLRADDLRTAQTELTVLSAVIDNLLGNS